MDSALNNLQRLICQKAQTSNQQIKSQTRSADKSLTAVKLYGNKYCLLKPFSNLSIQVVYPRLKQGEWVFTLGEFPTLYGLLDGCWSTKPEKKNNTFG